MTADAILAAAAGLGGSVLASLPNFRDFGGQPAGDGRRVRSGVLFRTQAFGDASADDLAAVAGLGLALVCDFRSPQETDPVPPAWPAGKQPERLHLGLLTDARLGYREFAATLLEQPDAQGLELAMRGIYRTIPAALAPALPGLFDGLLEGRLPLAICCRAGKDRTGVACAIVLASLGVSYQHILADYLASRPRMTPALAHELAATVRRIAGASLADEVALQVAEVRRSYLDAALLAIDEDFGGMAAYLREAAGLTPERLARLRARLLD